MNILAIESSCDETAAAVLQTGANFPSDPTDFRLLSNVVVSQIDIFKTYGGVIPEVAARSHLEAILPVIHQAIANAKSHLAQSPKISNFSPQNPTAFANAMSSIDAIAVTHTPGLLGSLLIGTLTARTLAILHDKPLYPIHHLKSHLYSALLPKNPPTSSGPTNIPSPTSTPSTPNAATNATIIFPALALIVSGGHTQILYLKSHTDFQIVATTRDDAVGECFDKVAKILGLPYPGGPAITQAARRGDPLKYSFPHPILKNPDNSRSLDFSFSGLKTAVLRTTQKVAHLPLNHPSSDLKNHLTPTQISDLAASFQNTATDILLENLQKAAQIYPAKTFIIAGGVSANQELIKKAQKLSQPQPQSQPQSQSHSHPQSHSPNPSPLASSPILLFPAPAFTGDNAAMVALAAAYEIALGATPTDPYHLNILPRSPIT